MFGISKGFSLLEIVIAIAIVGIMAIIVIPNFKRPKTQPREHFISQLNVLLQAAANNATLTGKVQRILFDFKNEKISIEQELDKKDSAGQAQFAPVKSDYLRTSIPLPDRFTVRNFYIKNNDELRGGTTNKSWFFITPEGRAQDISLVIDELNERPFKVQLNPFTLVFTIHETQL